MGVVVYAAMPYLIIDRTVGSNNFVRLYGRPAAASNRRISPAWLLDPTTEKKWTDYS